MALQVALNWDIFDGLSTDARNAPPAPVLQRAQTTRDALKRNLDSRGARDAARSTGRRSVGLEVAQRAVESALENVKLIQQKYNVGSSTILDLIDAQVQLQRAQSDRVSAPRRFASPRRRSTGCAASGVAGRKERVAT